MTITLAPSHETGIVENGNLSYNIQMAQDAARVWWQRHIWHRIDGRLLNPPHVENWIVSGTGRIGPHAKMRAVSMHRVSEEA